MYILSRRNPHGEAIPAIFLKENTCDCLTSDGKTEAFHSFEQIGYNIQADNKERDFRNPGVK